MYFFATVSYLFNIFKYLKNSFKGTLLICFFGQYFFSSAPSQDDSDFVARVCSVRHQACEAGRWMEQSDAVYMDTRSLVPASNIGESLKSIDGYSLCGTRENLFSSAFWTTDVPQGAFDIQGPWNEKIQTI